MNLYYHISKVHWKWNTFIPSMAANRKESSPRTACRINEKRKRLLKFSKRESSYIINLLRSLPYSKQQHEKVEARSSSKAKHTRP